MISYKATSIIFISLEMNYLTTQLVDHTDYFTIVKTGTQLVGYFTSVVIGVLKTRIFANRH